ncbi:MAG TPA: hypothetical protein H9950_10380 [Candidatus Bacteroides avicola]|uniref:Major fimbrial subunit protein N-terminal domain-containing protein n=1 Tax=Candidatus Bacteroides avicola TaxID=2838468 RepID=A0A9D2HW36_9BACE|nr:hypothetical protein [Candidatus Bacteroides avicola]
MKIKTLKKYAGGMALLTLLGVLPASCIKDDTAAVKETTLTLTVATRAGETVGNNEMDANEQMKTLRVIVARSSNNEILYNEYRDEIDDNASQYVFNFGELTIEESEDFDFYAIANEASLDLRGSGITSLEEVTNTDLTALKNCIINRDYNEIVEGNPLQIPQTAFKTIPVGAGEKKTATIQLEFVVAKISVTFTNQTGNSLYIDGLSIEDIKPDRGFLFDPNGAEISTVVMPENTTCTAVNGSERIWVGTNQPTTVKAYIYPTVKDDQNAFVLKANGYEDLELNREDGSHLTSLDRGEWLRINITLIPKVTEVYPDIEWEVVDWSSSEVEVPSFE